MKTFKVKFRDNQGPSSVELMAQDAESAMQIAKSVIANPEAEFVKVIEIRPEEDECSV